MKSVMLSIQPKYCELIASGRKTIEVRKSRPSIETPFKCCIYCTKPKKFIKGYADDDLFRHVNGRIECGFSYQLALEEGATPENNILSGKVIGEFVCDRIDEYSCEFWGNDDYMSPFHAMEQIRVLDYVDEDDSDWKEYAYVTGNEVENPDDCELCKLSCLTYAEIRKYVGIGDKTFYGWHISDLKIYDTPKELDEVRKPCKVPKRTPCSGCDYAGTYMERCERPCITRPPQSWSYVEEL